ncbi:MAG: hypothetical protein V1668_02600 [Patescibacteria group bacterium]
MFITGPVVINRSSWHYKFWCWTFRNGLWKKNIPSQRSICAYVQRIIWIGALAVVLHAFVYPFKWLVKDLLYNQVMAPLLKNRKSVASFLIWLLVVSLVFLLKIDHLLIGLIGLCSLILLIILLIIGIVSLVALAIKYAFACAIGPVWRFNCLLFHYLLIGGLKAEEFINNYPRFNRARGCSMLVTELILFYAVIAIPVLLGAYLIKSAGPDQLLAICSYLFASYIIAFMMTYIITKVKFRRSLRTVMGRGKPEEGRERRPKKVKPERIGPSWSDRNWKPFWIWMKAVKQKACPLIKFSD